MQYHHHIHDAQDPQACAVIECDCTHSCNPSVGQMALPEYMKALKDPTCWLNQPKAMIASQ